MLLKLSCGARNQRSELTVDYLKLVETVDLMNLVFLLVEACLRKKNEDPDSDESF